MSRAESGLPASELSASELLAFLSRRGGQEYSARLLSPAAPASGKRARSRDQAVVPAPERPLYRFTLRGQQVQATGPAGLTRQLSPATFLQVFGAQRFGDLKPTGQLSDLGPLFAAP